MRRPTSPELVLNRSETTCDGSTSTVQSDASRLLGCVRLTCPQCHQHWFAVVIRGFHGVVRLWCRLTDGDMSIAILFDDLPNELLRQLLTCFDDQSQPLDRWWVAHGRRRI